MQYTKQELLNDIHDLVEKYITQELEARMPAEIIMSEDPAEVIVESDSEGDDIDTTTGDIWDIKNQIIVGRKDLKSKTKMWFSRVENTTPVTVSVNLEASVEEITDKLIKEVPGTDKLPVIKEVPVTVKEVPVIKEVPVTVKEVPGTKNTKQNTKQKK